MASLFSQIANKECGLEFFRGSRTINNGLHSQKNIGFWLMRMRASPRPGTGKMSLFNLQMRTFCYAFCWLSESACHSPRNMQTFLHSSIRDPTLARNISYHIALVRIANCIFRIHEIHANSSVCEFQMQMVMRNQNRDEIKACGRSFA